jgi:5'-3' exonuclease
LNIRTNGIEILLSIYADIFKNDAIGLTKGTNIHWPGLKRLISRLATMENDNLNDECLIRNRWEKRGFKSGTLDEKMTRLSHLPTQLRDIEKIIAPGTDGWRERYYTHLLGFEPSDYYVSRLCTNYLEGLEWTFKYYSEGCYDWRWRYKFHYAPLFKDLLRYMPNFNTHMITRKPKNPVSPDLQLAYVLPPEAMYLLKNKVREKVTQLGIHPKEMSFKWAYCKYFWEAHMELPGINISWLEKEINSLNTV